MVRATIAPRWYEARSGGRRERAQKLGVNSGAIVREMSKLVGGGGGGTDVTRIEEALERGVEMVREKVG